MAERIFSIVIALLSGGGLFLQSGILAHKPRKNMFVYYTNLSNLIIFFYHILLFISGFTPECAVYRALKAPSVQFIAALMIWVTHLIYHFVLGPIYAKMSRENDIKEGIEPDGGKGFFSRYVIGPMVMGGKGNYDDGRTLFGNICVHYLAPLLTLAEWFSCADKAVPFYACFLWLLVPLVYFLFAMLRAKSGVPITKSGNLYPYPFMDIELLGAKRFAVNTAVILTAFFLLSCLIYGVAVLMA